MHSTARKRNAPQRNAPQRQVRPDFRYEPRAVTIVKDEAGRIRTFRARDGAYVYVPVIRLRGSA